MSRDAGGEAPLGAAGAAGNRLVSEPAFELLFSEIIAYTGAYVSHTAASHATDMLRASEAGVEGEEEGADGEGEDADAVGTLVDPSPASVGAGQQMLPVSPPNVHWSGDRSLEEQLRGDALQGEGDRVRPKGDTHASQGGLALCQRILPDACCGMK